MKGRRKAALFCGTNPYQPVYNTQVNPGTDDSPTVIAARAGDHSAFALLVARYQDVAFRAAYLILREPTAAQDVAQDAFIRAYHSLHAFHETEPFRPWLLRIVTNLALNDVRARSRRQGLFTRLVQFPREAEPSPEPAAIAGEERDLLWRAIHDLKADDQIILYLRYYLDLPEREIATVISRPPGTVKSRLHRASDRLRDVIERRYPSLRPAGGELPDA